MQPARNTSGKHFDLSNTPIPKKQQIDSNRTRKVKHKKGRLIHAKATCPHHHHHSAHK